MTQEFLKALPVVNVNAAVCQSVEPQKAELLWVPIAKLLIDTRYQRDMTLSGKAHVARIAEKFDWKKFTPLIVSPQGENFAVIDGQHRATAAKARGFTTCPAICMPFYSFREAASSFAAINGNVTPISVLHVFKAARAAGESWAAELQAVAEEAGVVVLTYPKDKKTIAAHETMAISSLRQLIAVDREVAVSVLMAITRGRHFGKVGLNAYVVNALGVAAVELSASRVTFQVMLDRIDLPDLIRQSASGAEEAGISRAAWLAEVIIDSLRDGAAA
jgi:ParB-like nuclease domain